MRMNGSRAGGLHRGEAMMHPETGLVGVEVLARTGHVKSSIRSLRWYLCDRCRRPYLTARYDRLFQWMGAYCGAWDCLSWATRFISRG